MHLRLPVPGFAFFWPANEPWACSRPLMPMALASLITQAKQLLPQAVHDARDQELTWAQIGELLDTTAATAARRYRIKP
jgi:hypothetical protein